MPIRYDLTEKQIMKLQQKFEKEKAETLKDLKYIRAKGVDDLSDSAIERVAALAEYHYYGIVQMESIMDQVDYNNHLQVLGMYKNINDAKIARHKARRYAETYDQVNGIKRVYLLSADVQRLQKVFEQEFSIELAASYPKGVHNCEALLGKPLYAKHEDLNQVGASITHISDKKLPEYIGNFGTYNHAGVLLWYPKSGNANVKRRALEFFLQAKDLIDQALPQGWVVSDTAQEEIIGGKCFDFVEHYAYIVEIQQHDLDILELLHRNFRTIDSAYQKGEITKAEYTKLKQDASERMRFEEELDDRAHFIGNSY